MSCKTSERALSERKERPETPHTLPAVHVPGASHDSIEHNGKMRPARHMIVLDVCSVTVCFELYSNLSFRGFAVSHSPVLVRKFVQVIFLQFYLPFLCDYGLWFLSFDVRFIEIPG
jgi:hypothetical protein